MKSSCLIFSFILIISLLVNCQITMAQPASTDSVEIATALYGLHFDKAERDSMRGNLSVFRDFYRQMRSYPLPNAVLPALVFNPLPHGFEAPRDFTPNAFAIPANVSLPVHRDDLAFYSIPQLASLIKNRQITSLELTKFFLERLKKYDPQLHCVITLTEEYALKQAALADRELVAGKYRGPLHGIPYGAKDLLAFRGYRTTWGAEPYKDQKFDYTATVIRKLEEAGAVLVAKLTLGELAMDDVWFGGMTRNPWDLEQGSSGSSAGSASATSAGLVPFAIGSETWGSIVSPADRCGVTGLRPTFGMVSRYGAMALSWSMDKIGPICRSAEDCAIVFDAIYGTDPKDPSTIKASFNYPSDPGIQQLRIGYFRDLFWVEYPNRANDSILLEAIRKSGRMLIPLKLPGELPVNALSIILEAEASAAFEELTLSDRDTLLERQGKENWPNYFRRGRMIPAVEYIRANRLRSRLIEDFSRLFEGVDVILTPSFEGDQMLMTNLTGNPCVVIPDGFDATGHPASICMVGQLFDEGRLLAFARYVQNLTGHHLAHPPLFSGK